MGKNLKKMVDEKVVDPDAANNLHADVIAKIENMTEEEVATVIKFKLNVSGDQVWTPDQDGSIF